MDNGRIVSKPLDNMHHPLRSGQTLGERIVLTSSFPGQIQATTVQQYLEQFWPDNSERLLGVIQRAFSEERDNSEYPPMFCYIREPTICVELSDSDLVVSFTGGCFLSVVELAEQLAWLSAATQASLGSTFEGPPSVYLEAKKSIDDPAYLLRSRWDLRLGRLPFDATDHSLTLLHQLRSHGTLLRLAPPLITGFRTAHRPNNDLGVEVPSHLLLDIVTPQEEFRVEGGGVFLCGKNLTLRLMKKVDDVLVWHVSSSVRVCACQLHYHPTLSKKEISRLDLSALKQFRHIIGLCHTAGASSGEDSQSRSSWETSLETDELSSELSEDELIAMTGPDEALSPFVDAVARRLLDEHRRATARQQAATRVLSPGTHGEAPKDTHGSSLRLAHGSDQQRSRSFCKGKGRAAKDQGQDSDDEGSRRRQPKKLRLNDPPPKGKPKQLACHFWKLNPRAHRSCFRFTLEDTSRVKQHLKRKHTPEYYCERCWAIFPDHGTHQTHVKVKVVTCPSRTCNFPEITYRQREALRIRSTSNTEEGRWFDMWDIIFPGSPRPPSPYIESDLSEELCELMEFAPAHGPAIMAAEIQASIQAGNGDPGIPSEQLAGFLQRVITPRCITLIFERWLAQHASLQPEAGAHSPIAEPSYTAPSGPSQNQSISNASSSTRQNTPEGSGSCLDSGSMMQNHAQIDQDEPTLACLRDHEMPSDQLRPKNTEQEEPVISTVSHQFQYLFPVPITDPCIQNQGQEELDMLEPSHQPQQLEQTSHPWLGGDRLSHDLGCEGRQLGEEGSEPESWGVDQAWGLDFGFPTGFPNHVPFDELDVRLPGMTTDADMTGEEGFGNPLRDV